MMNLTQHEDHEITQEPFIQKKVKSRRCLLEGEFTSIARLNYDEALVSGVHLSYSLDDIQPTYNSIVEANSLPLPQNTSIINPQAIENYEEQYPIGKEIEISSNREPVNIDKNNAILHQDLIIKKNDNLLADCSSEGKLEFDHTNDSFLLNTTKSYLTEHSLKDVELFKDITLPKSLKRLYNIALALDQTINFFNSRKKLTSFENLKKSVEKFTKAYCVIIIPIGDSI